MSRDQGPGVSLFQGAENLSLEINGKSPEEEEDIEDENRRKEELHDLLKSAFDDLNTDDDSSVANNSHYSGASHPHETGTECENIQPSISPCEVDYNKVIEFEPNHRPDDTGCSGDLDHRLYCRDTSRSEPHQVSSTSHQDKSHSSSCHNISNVSSSQDFHPMTATPVGRKKAKQNAKQKNQQHQQNNLNNNQCQQQNNQQQNQPHQLLNNQHRHQNDKHHNQQHLLNDHQQLNNHQHRHDQQHNGQQHYEISPGDGVGAVTALPDSGSPQQQNYVHKFKQLEKQYEKRVREIEELRHYIQQMDAKFDAEKVQMEKLLLAELSDKVKLNSELKCSEEEKQRVQVLEREIQELRDNVNNLVKIKENTNKELDLSKITIYDLQQKISLLEQKKNVSKSMKSYERIIEQLKCDYEKQEKHYQSVQNKVLSEFERLKGEAFEPDPEEDEQLLFDLKKMKNSFVNEINYVREQLLTLGKENEKLQNKCDAYEKKNKSVMDELKTLKAQMGTQQNGDAIKPIDNRVKPDDGDVKSVDNLVVKPSGIPIVKPRDKRVKPDDSSVVKSGDSSVVKSDENLIVKPSYNRAEPDENLVDKPCDSRDPKSSKTRVVKPNDNRVKPKSNRDLKPDVNPVIPNEALYVKPRDNLVKFDDSRIVKPSVNRDGKSDHSRVVKPCNNIDVKSNDNRVVKPSDKEIVESDDSRIVKHSDNIVVKPVNPVVKHSDNEVVKLSDERNVKSIENLVVKPRGSRDKTEDNGYVKPNNDLAVKPEDQVLNLETNNSDKEVVKLSDERNIKC
ncbi:general transcriptional corepressor trfA-like [Diaphorina citri]|uniref:General transcriptional corepressor trfA-like n=1 Tax=Diaphorina citri TaxID=121845 RepID=A0A3Q0IXD0_DIACI|nr:general transcriptional corepressor trfA-like [Diaphorina citri]